MSVQITIDSSDFSALGRNLHNLPADLKRNAFHSAAKHTLSKARTQVVRRLAAYVKLPVGVVRGATRAEVSGTGDLRIIVRSKWIPLAKLGARQTRTGVSVRARGSYAHAFLATMNSGHRGVMMRDGSARLPIHELFGPNPAHALGADRRGEFQDLAAEIVERDFLPRLLREVDRRIGKIG